jgi:hypothetical protein
MAGRPHTAVPTAFASQGAGVPNNIPMLDANFADILSFYNDSAIGWNNYSVDTGTANNYVTALTPPPSAYIAGMWLSVQIANTNTGTANINVSSLGLVPIVTPDGNPLTGGELQANYVVSMIYDGTSFRIAGVQGPGQIYSVRLRSFNAVGNPNFEVDQRNVGSTVSGPSGNLIIDRWKYTGAGTYNLTAGQQSATLPDGCIPGTSFRISRSFLRTTVTTAATLGASDNLQLFQFIEGPQFRELSNDVHSISILCRSNVANLKFGLTLQDPTGAYALGSLCTLGAANTLTLITLPNLPIWASGGTFVTTPGALAYFIIVVLAAGASKMLPAANVWQSGAAGLVGVPGQSNFVAAAGNTFDLMFIQHEPGPNCTTLIDKPFSQNLDECLRYFAKSYDYGVKPPTASSTPGFRYLPVIQNGLYALGSIAFPKPMAKDPAITIYANDGTASAATLVGGANASLAAISGSSQGGFAGFQFTSAVTLNTVYGYHYTADTGW